MKERISSDYLEKGNMSKEICETVTTCTEKVRNKIDGNSRTLKRRTRVDKDAEALQVVIPWARVASKILRV